MTAYKKHIERLEKLLESIKMIACDESKVNQIEGVVRYKAQAGAAFSKAAYCFETLLGNLENWSKESKDEI